MTPKDIERYLAANEAGFQCPSCGNVSWSVVDAPSPSWRWCIGAMRDDGAVVVPSPTLPLIVLVCGQCSHVRLHADMPVRAWLAANPESVAGPRGSSNA